MDKVFTFLEGKYSIPQWEGWQQVADVVTIPGSRGKTDHGGRKHIPENIH